MKLFSWKIGYGSQVYLGINPFIGDRFKYILSHSLIYILHSKNIQSLSQARRHNRFNDGTLYWIASRDLELRGYDVAEWDNFVSLLNRAGILLRNEDDQIVGVTENSNGLVTSKKAYESIPSEVLNIMPKWWVNVLW